MSILNVNKLKIYYITRCTVWLTVLVRVCVSEDLVKDLETLSFCVIVMAIAACNNSVKVSIQI